ncbi:Collagen alpha-1(XXII) chain [Chelonia mydas]|uniref:Collagen alpha-1(XXII) chain n=1 Tax=Chelonia mydas TaxID=8469 RepID=M7BT25_CHEMY|nr:Collagen alpha-1(XXII) chain [Chelonia mydas]
MTREVEVCVMILFQLLLAESSIAPAGCKNVHYDLVFILDTSSSVGKEDFEKVRQWVSNLVETFEIGLDKTRVGVVRYSDRPATEFDLGRYQTREAIKEAARNIKYYGGNTNTGDALRYINTYSFSKEAGGRPSDPTSQKVAILLTDGRSQDYVMDAATAARKAGIRIFAVGVGEALKEELDEIASDPKSAHVFHVSDYNAIDKIRGKLRRRLCETLNGHSELCAAQTTLVLPFTSLSPQISQVKGPPLPVSYGMYQPHRLLKKSRRLWKITIRDFHDLHDKHGALEISLQV